MTSKFNFEVGFEQTSTLMHPLTKYLSLQTILLDVFVPHQVHELTYFFVCTTQMWDSQRRLHELRYRALSLTAQVPAMEHRPLIPPVKPFSKGTQCVLKKFLIKKKIFIQMK